MGVLEYQNDYKMHEKLKKKFANCIINITTLLF